MKTSSSNYLVQINVTFSCSILASKIFIAKFLIHLLINLFKFHEYILLGVTCDSVHVELYKFWYWSARQLTTADVDNNFFLVHIRNNRLLLDIMSLIMVG